MAGVSYEVLTAPTVEPLDLTAVKNYLRVDYSDEDSVISQLITDARTLAEELTHRALAVQTIRATIEPELSASGALSGSIIGNDFDLYRQNERVTAVPFGICGPVLQLPQTSGGSGVGTNVTLVEYQLTYIDVPEWTTLAALDANNNAAYRLDVNTDPARLVVFPMLAARRHRVTYTTGYPNGYCPSSLLNPMKQLVAFWYDNRDGAAPPEGIVNQFVRKRVFSL